MFPFQFSVKAPQNEIALDIAGKKLMIALKRSAAARRYTLRLRTAKRDLVLTMPARSSLANARAFILRHRDWIEQRLENLPQAIPYQPGATIPLRGVPHLLYHDPQRPARHSVWIEPGTSADQPMRLCASGDLLHFSRRISDYLKRQAKSDLSAAVAAHSARIGYKPKSIRLKDTRSRWGSCSSKGALNFSWRLILAPPHVLDYIAAHEVAHLIHLNHGAAFWTLAGTLAPQLEQAEDWLKTHGLQLHLYG